MDSPIVLRHDMYQTDTHVVVTILLKTYKPKEVKVDIENSTVDVVAQFDGHSDYNLHLELFSDIVSDKSTWKQLSSKIEIKLHKRSALRWNSLEKDTTTEDYKLKDSEDSSKSCPLATIYPSSSTQKRDWDKIVFEIVKTEMEEDKKADGDAAVNKLFETIYKDGSEEVQRAMNKSFLESGGTVLSTNWAEVGKDRVDVKPPSGMEYKEWSK